MHGTLLSKTLHCSSSTEAIAALGNTCWVDLDNYNRDFIMEQHAGIGVGKSSVVFVYFLNFSVVKKVMIIGVKLYVVWLFSSHRKAIITYLPAALVVTGLL